MLAGGPHRVDGPGCVEACRTTAADSRSAVRADRRALAGAATRSRPAPPGYRTWGPTPPRPTTGRRPPWRPISNHHQAAGDLRRARAQARRSGWGGQESGVAPRVEAGVPGPARAGDDARRSRRRGPPAVTPRPAEGASRMPRGRTSRGGRPVRLSAPAPGRPCTESVAAADASRPGRPMVAAPIAGPPRRAGTPISAFPWPGRRAGRPYAGDEGRRSARTPADPPARRHAGLGPRADCRQSGGGRGVAPGCATGRDLARPDRGRPLAHRPPPIRGPAVARRLVRRGGRPDRLTPPAVRGFEGLARRRDGGWRPREPGQVRTARPEGGAFGCRRIRPGRRRLSAPEGFGLPVTADPPGRRVAGPSRPVRVPGVVAPRRTSTGQRRSAPHPGAPADSRRRSGRAMNPHSASSPARAKADHRTLDLSLASRESLTGRHGDEAACERRLATATDPGDALPRRVHRACRRSARRPTGPAGPVRGPGAT